MGKIDGSELEEKWDVKGERKRVKTIIDAVQVKEIKPHTHAHYKHYGSITNHCN